LRHIPFDDIDLLPRARLVHVVPGILFGGCIIVDEYFLYGHGIWSIVKVGLAAGPFLEKSIYMSQS